MSKKSWEDMTQAERLYQIMREEDEYRESHGMPSLYGTYDEETEDEELG